VEEARFQQGVPLLVEEPQVLAIQGLSRHQMVRLELQTLAAAAAAVADW
jgi:hypothetical protein